MDKKESGGNVFSGRNFRLVFFGALVSELGALMYSFAVSFYILEISGNNAFLQGIYLALCGGVLLLFTPIGGVLGDRFNKAKIMFVCDYIKGGLIVAATLLMLVFPDKDAHIAVLFAVGALGNAISGIFNPASGALLPHIVEEGKLQQANAYFSVKSASESILGVALAGVMYAALPITLLFFLVGACFLLSGLSEMFIRYAHRPPRERLTARLALRDMGEGLRYLRARKAVTALIASMLFINFFIAPLSGNFIPYFVRTDVALAPSYLFNGTLTPEMWSSVFSMLIGVSSLLGSMILSARKQAEKCGRQTALRLCGMAGVMLLIAGGYWLLVFRGVSLNGFLLLFCLCCLLIGLLVVYINVPVSTVMMRIVDKDKLSKVTSIINVAAQGLIPIASVLAGVVLQYLGCAPLLFICALGFTAAALWLLFNKQVREI